MQVRSQSPRWRDEEMSMRHHKYGYECAAISISFLEMHYGTPVGLFEIKHESAGLWDLNSRSALAFIELANRAGLPAFYVVRANNFSWFKVTALNTNARKLFGRFVVKVLAEPEYISLLYSLRGLHLPPSTAQRCYCD